MTDLQIPAGAPASLSQKPLLDLRDSWIDLSVEERLATFAGLPQVDADDFFLSLGPEDQAELLVGMPLPERRHWLRMLAPDDLADLLQILSPARKEEFLALLEPQARREVTPLLAYEEDEAGGLMNPRFARVRPEMRVDEAIKYLRRQAQHLETMRYIYVLANDQTLLGVASLRQLFLADSGKAVKEVMRTGVIAASETEAQEDIKNLFTSSSLNAIPVIDAEGRMKGIVTLDDIVDVVEEEATEDIQRLGGSEVLDAPYLKIGLLKMIKKRAGWLVVLFVGEMLTATAMGYYEREIERAVVLALFIPLIISSGGNSGSQASTLVVRAIALGEVRLRDWWKVFARELLVGSALGLILGAIGLMRIVFWPLRTEVYGEHFVAIGLTVALSLIGIVLWGSLSGSMLPFLLKRCRLDPATASAPFVATLVDVSGLVIYFTVASIVLKGLLL